MIAIDITKFLKSLPQVRGPAVFLNALIFASLDRDVYFIFNPHYVGSQLYFQSVSAKDFPAFWEQQLASSQARHGRRITVRKLLRFVRDRMVRFSPGLVRYRLFQKARGRCVVIRPDTSVVHHSSIKQMISFLASDSMWGLPMPETKKTLFLYDITFFEILRMISSPVNCASSPFIVGHIIDVNRAISEAHSLIVPTHYLAEQLPLHFPAARHRRVDVVPLASCLTGSNDLYFKPLRPSKNSNSILVVCGFDGFQNDNKGMGAMLDIICLHKKLFASESGIHFTFITPQLGELMQRIKDLGIGDRITLRSCLPVSELLKEYRQAKCLWVHSIDEGFCLPVLEAAMLGVPALVSDVPSLREIWGDTVDYIDPFNRYEAVNQLQAYWTGHGVAAKGANTLHAQNYTIEKTVEGVWAALEQVA